MQPFALAHDIQRDWVWPRIWILVRGKRPHLASRFPTQRR